MDEKKEKEVIELFYKYLRTLNSTEREDFLDRMFDGVCRYCGGVFPCYCRNDD